VRVGLQREDDYRAPGKPTCDWQDRQAREELVDALVRDAYRALTPCGTSGWTPGGRGRGAVGHGHRPRHRGDR
jgi:hypothetical protein